MTLVSLRGPKSSRDPSVLGLLAECVASSPLAEAQKVDATKVGYPSLVCTKQVEAVKIVTAHDYPPPPPFAGGHIWRLHLWA